MAQSPSWEANRSSASQEIPHILWNPKVHYRIHKCPPPFPTLNQIGPVHTRTSQFLMIHLIIIFPHTPFSPKISFPPDFPTKTLSTPVLFPICATCPAHLILVDFITRKILVDQYRSLGFSLICFLSSHFTLSFLGPIILLYNLFSKSLGLRSSLSVSDPYETTGKIIVMYIFIF